jgi:Bax protein
MPVIFKMPLTYVVVATVIAASLPFISADYNTDSQADAVLSHRVKSYGEYVHLIQMPTSHRIQLSFAEIPAGAKRKLAFVSYFLPIIQEENTRLQNLREQLLHLDQQTQLSDIQEEWLSNLARHYKHSSFDVNNQEHWNELLIRVDVVSPSLALAQSANESAWGTSRFATEGNNFFGQWCFTAGCGIVPRSRAEGATHEVASYQTPIHSVTSYMHNLNSNRAFAELREIRAEIRGQKLVLKGSDLAAGLTLYSARGDHYVTELQTMIRQNKWAELDKTPTI